MVHSSSDDSVVVDDATSLATDFDDDSQRTAGTNECPHTICDNEEEEEEVEEEKEEKELFLLEQPEQSIYLSSKAKDLVLPSAPPSRVEMASGVGDCNSCKVKEAPSS